MGWGGVPVLWWPRGATEGPRQDLEGLTLGKRPGWPRGLTLGPGMRVGVGRWIGQREVWEWDRPQ